MRLPTILPEYREGNEIKELPAYAWPGGYAIAYLVDDGEFLCAKCVNDESNPVHDSSTDSSADGWRVDGYMTADWREDDAWTCAHCNAVIDGDS